MAEEQYDGVPEDDGDDGAKDDGVEDYGGEDDGDEGVEDDGDRDEVGAGEDDMGYDRERRRRHARRRVYQRRCAPAVTTSSFVTGVGARMRERGARRQRGESCLRIARPVMMRNAHALTKQRVRAAPSTRSLKHAQTSRGLLGD